VRRGGLGVPGSLNEQLEINGLAKVRTELIPSGVSKAFGIPNCLLMMFKAAECLPSIVAMAAAAAMAPTYAPVPVTSKAPAVNNIVWISLSAASKLKSHFGTAAFLPEYKEITRYIRNVNSFLPNAAAIVSCKKVTCVDSWNDIRLI
jgi:hypothetical protein